MDKKEFRFPRYRVTYLIDVVGENPKDYTRYFDTDAKDEVDAIKKWAISITQKDSSNIEWINQMKGTIEEVRMELLSCRYCLTNVEIINNG